MKKKFVVVAAGLGLAQLALLTTAGLAQSAQNTKKDTVTHLNEVVVTASRSAKKLSDIGRVVTVISSQEINRSQGKTLPQLLNTVAGITFSGAQNNIGISSSVFLRGATTGNTLILIDGFPVNNASSIDGSYDLNAFSLDQIDHIEILKGSGSTLYGSDAVAGVINIITKHPQNQDLVGDVQFSGGSYNTFKGSIGLNGRLNKTGISLNFSNLRSDGFAAATDTTGKMGFKKDGYLQQSLSLNLNQYLSNKFTLNGNFQLSANTGDLPYGAFKDDKDYNYNNLFLFGGLGAKLVLPKGSLLFNVSQNTVWNNFYNSPPDNDSTHSVTQNIGRITNAEVVLNQALGEYFDITSGGSFKYSNTGQYSLYEQAYYHPKPVDSYISGNNNISSAYTSLFFKSDIFHMELGGRYNRHSKYGNNLTYTVNPSVIIANQLKVFITVASAYKAPSLYQLYSQYRNSDLKPETTTSYEAGFDWDITKALSFNTVFYKRKTTNVIYFYTDASYKSTYQNGNLEDDQGFESELKYRKNDFTASAYAAYVTGTQTDTKGVDTHNLLRRPRNTYGGNVSYQLIKALSVGVNYKYTGERSDTRFLDVAPYSRVEGLKAYNLFDVHVQASATKNLSLFVDLNNVFNVKYTDWIGYSTRGFNAYGGIKYLLN
ncbi:vitamin B12 transporter [Mucilaginibacter gracilis]|uniref:Vitamin B12 transporter n=1 Tax=Mucilaginibacter gracilis TaxID=423350 RepID=A0A495J8K2_9SPHI|nr:TonB-dependent receptor [Mucilaginibacter gracilis]RKR84798.1 vitamin B12 transporter [Mucilaginibacter gracilis]